MNASVFLNIGIRASTMLSRFILMFMIAKYLKDEEMGLYGLLTTTIIFSLYIVGLDFYIYSTRELIKNKKQCWGMLLKSQALLVAILYILYIPLLCAIFTVGFLPWKVFYYLIILLFLEHLCQEFQRIIIADQRPLAANVGLFIRTGLWPFIFVPLLYFNLIPRNLESVLMAWIVGDVLATIFFILILTKMQLGGWKYKIDWHWLANGTKICILFLLGTLALKFNAVLERYWLQDLTTIQIVGVYSFFIGISSVLTNFLDAGVISFKYPKLIKAFSDKNKNEFFAVKKDLNVQVILWTVLLVTVSLILFDTILQIIGKPIYYNYKDLYYIILASTAISCIGLLPHYELYAMHKDKIIIICHLISLLCFILSAYSIQFVSRLYAIPVSVLITQLFILGFKTITVRRIRKYEYSSFNQFSSKI